MVPGTKTLFFFLIITLGFGCSKKEPKPKQPVNVEIAIANVRPVTIYIETIGNVLENLLVQIRPQVQGILIKRHVEDGQYVKKDDLLYEIDPKPYQAVFDQAKATLHKDQTTLELAQITAKRNEDLMKKEFISKLAWEQFQTNVKTAQSQVEMDKASLEQAQINLNYTKIFAPIDGKLSITNVQPGNLVVVDNTTFLVDLRQIDPIQVQFTVPQKDFQELQKEQLGKTYKFGFTLPYNIEKQFEGEIFFIDNHVDLQSGTITLKGRIPNPDHLLWPGQFGNVRIFLKKVPNALTIPFSAVQIGQNGSYVYKLKPDSTVEQVNIITGQKDGSDITVLSGLNKGDKVVINGQVNISNGDKVTVVDSKSGGSPK